ncbi:hypothetical protein C8R45DRAFT_942505 [Mycena sanguinolenta]|nr:hypothetical protein C8R45DRAFT_942505 [Mycena sanguinolenta]
MVPTKTTARKAVEEAKATKRYHRVCCTQTDPFLGHKLKARDATGGTGPCKQLYAMQARQLATAAKGPAFTYQLANAINTAATVTTPKTRSAVSVKTAGTLSCAANLHGFAECQDGVTLGLPGGILARSTAAMNSRQSVLLLMYALKGFSLKDTPIPGLLALLEMRIPESFAYVEVRFNLNTKASTLSAANKALDNSLRDGQLKSYVLFFF